MWHTGLMNPHSYPISSYAHNLMSLEEDLQDSYSLTYLPDSPSYTYKSQEKQLGSGPNWAVPNGPTAGHAPGASSG